LRSSGNPTEEEVMSRRLLFVACACVAFGAALAPAAADGPPQGVAQDGVGILSPDRSIRYLTWTNRSQTVLEAVRTRGGTVVNEVLLRGGLSIPAVAWTPTGISADGRTLVLASYPWSRGPATFLLLSVPDFETQQVVTLRGRWAFDAISPRARVLYLIQSLDAGGRYLVRAYDLRRDRLVERVIADRREPGPMLGSAAARAATRDGRWQYTLYERGDGSAFVHVLNTIHLEAVCVDLKKGGWVDPWDTRMWVSRDGRSLHLRQFGPAGPALVLATAPWQALAAQR
jgi:hypothetical protein